MIIDLRSDTVTKPSQEMLEAMFLTPVGDDVFGEDPTVINLENKIAAMFGMEAGLFCPSGTMTNQIAIKLFTSPGDEIICDTSAHVYNYEGGGIAFNSGCSVRLINGDAGRFTAEDVVENINPDNVHHPATRLVVIENTSNRGGGSIWEMDQLLEISKVCRKNQLQLHLDGARIFNALAETGETPDEHGHIFDSISICLSKGLGAPVGSVLAGKKEFIKKARRVRKVLGGGMRQAGYLAAAGIFALDHHVHRIKEDHHRAKEIAATLSGISLVEKILPVKTNIIIFKISPSMPLNNFISKLADRNILVVPFGKQTVRMVTHLNFDNDQLDYVVTTLKSAF
jgi:threonine aldolase